MHKIGALQMRVKTTRDIFLPLSKVSAVEKGIILDEDAIARIYSSGHSRIPVYQQLYDSTGKATNDVSSIIGILLTRQLIIVDADDKRPLSTLPLVLPQCVSPDTSLVDLLNIFQERASWRTCQLAVVCDSPILASRALDQGLPIPEDAKVLGIVTMEDVLEELIQENILDEFDRDEVIDERRARNAYQKWKRFIENKRKERISTVTDAKNGCPSSEVTSVVTSSEAPTTDQTPLIGHMLGSRGTSHACNVTHR
jgi:metal transporter CNNM